MQVVGYMSGISAKGNTYCTIYALQPLIDRQGWAGQKPIEIRCVPEVANMVRPEMIGRECNLTFTMDSFQKAVCNGISL